MCPGVKQTVEYGEGGINRNRKYELHIWKCMNSHVVRRRLLVIRGHIHAQNGIGRPVFTIPYLCCEVHKVYAEDLVCLCVCVCWGGDSCTVGLVCYSSAKRDRTC